MTSNFCKTSWHPYGHTPEECPDCRLCHESKIPKKLEFRPHLTTGVIARDRDMEMLVLWLNELRDYLQAKEEASKSSWHTFWSYSEKCVCCDKTLEELEKTEEASKGECKPVCGHLHYHTFSAYSDKCLGCKGDKEEILSHSEAMEERDHKWFVKGWDARAEEEKGGNLSNPPEHEDEWEEYTDSSGNKGRIRAYPKKEAWEKDIEGIITYLANRSITSRDVMRVWHEVEDYIKTNFVSKEKIKREIDNLIKTKEFNSTDEVSANAMSSGYRFALSDLTRRLKI